MEIARALTKRYKPHEGPHAGENGVTSPNRSISSRRPHKESNASSSAINRAKISLPIELLSTTNVLAYNAPDIYPQQQQQLGDQVSSPVVSIPESVPSTASSSASTRSYDDSASDRDGSTAGTALTAASSITTTPDYSREGSPAAMFPDKHQHQHQHQHGHHQHHQLREYFGRVGSPTAPGSGVVSPIDSIEHTGFDKQQQQQQQHEHQEQQEHQPQQPPSKLATKDIPIVVDTLPTPQSPAPVVPTRALSHTKKTHQALARRRSRSRTSDPAHANANTGASAFRGSGSSSSGGFARDLAHVPPPLSPSTTVSTVNSSTLSLPNTASPTTPPASANSNANSTATTAHRSSQEMFAARAPASASISASASSAASAHPFGAELAQVKELAEEFCGSSSRGDNDTVRVWSEEEQFLTDHGLRKFAVEDYLCEIRPLFAGVFEDDVALAAEGLYGRFMDGSENKNKNGGGNVNAGFSSGYYHGAAGSRKDKKKQQQQRQRGMTTSGATATTTRHEADGRDRAAECFAEGTAWF